MTVDPEGYLHFSNVTKKDNSDEFLYACSASSGFRNEIKLGNRVFLQVSRSLCDILDEGRKYKHESIIPGINNNHSLNFENKHSLGVLSSSLLSSIFSLQSVNISLKF